MEKCNCKTTLNHCWHFGSVIFLLFFALCFLLQLSSPSTAHARAVECAACHSSGLGTSPHTVQHNNSIVPESVCGQCHDANVRIEHTDNRAIDCELCHTPDGPLFNARYDAAITLGMGPGGTNVDCWQCHDFFNHLPQHNNASTPAQCSACHTSNITDTHNNNCALCHESTNTIVSGTIANGRSDGGNQAVTCGECHTAGGAISHGTTCDTAGTAHDALTPSVNCSSCHSTADFAALCTTHRNDCTVCHLSTDQRVVDTITAGRVGTTVSCENCHDMHNGSADHNMLSTSVNCSTCHATVDFNAVLGTHRSDCTLCHTSTRQGVIDAIDAGRAGTPVNCENCHTAHDGPTAHNNLSTTVNCSTCHTTGDFNAILTTHQADCTVCHSSTRQAVIDTINTGKGASGTPVNCENCHTAHRPAPS